MGSGSSCCSSAAEALATSTRLSRLSGSSWPASTITDLHEALSETFNPDGSDEHHALLEAVWNALLAPAKFRRRGPEWKRVGFQGEDPATDVRGGGVLSMQCLAHFARLHTFGLKAMLQDLEDLESLGTTQLGFYPLSTTAIVVCSKLCDAVGISAGMRGPISSADLATLLQSPPATTTAADLWPMLADSRRRGGFYGLFSLLLADFHVRFTLARASYMAAGALIDTTVEVLARRLAIVRSQRRRSSLSPLSAAAGRLSVGKAAAYRGTKSFKALFDLYATPDPKSDAGESHCQDVHALLTATELWRVSTLKKLRAAVRIVALDNAGRTAARARGEVVESRDVTLSRTSLNQRQRLQQRQTQPQTQTQTQTAAANAFARVAASAGTSAGSSGLGSDAAAAEDAVESASVAVRLSLERVGSPRPHEDPPEGAAPPSAAAAEAAAACSVAVRLHLEVLPPERPRNSYFVSLVDAAVAANEARVSAELQPPMELALPTSSSMRSRKVTTDVQI